MEKCSFCNPMLKETLAVCKPTLHQINTLIEATATFGDMLHCGENGEVCEPLQRLQKTKDIIEKEIKQR